MEPGGHEGDGPYASLQWWNHELLNMAKPKLFQGLSLNSYPCYGKRLLTDGFSSQLYSVKISFL